MDIEAILAEVLGSTYGGPSLGTEGSDFVIYSWFDAPCGEEVHARGSTIEDCVLAYLEGFPEVAARHGVEIVS
jgi:hypothetical protein